MNSHRAQFGGPDGVLRPVVVDLHPAVTEIHGEVLPLIEGIADGLAEQALRQDGTAAGEPVDGLFEPLVDGTAL